jgi:signal transduction histidine kinase
VALPLRYQGDVQGELLLAPRAPSEGFSPADLALLREVARQAGMLARAARLSAELQSAREQLVTAREEERRRLRRDLHDGLGPQLASQTLTLTTAARLIRRDPEAAERLLHDATRHAEAAIKDIRRLVYALRPPALDDLGLLGALREWLANVEPVEPGEQRGLQIRLIVPDALPSLSAATEVACYRIIQEAVTNVARHAHAQTCTVTLLLDDGLHLEVCDDGHGLPQPFQAGVGIVSMRERAEELGGTCALLPRPQSGTALRVWLPLERGA